MLKRGPEDAYQRWINEAMVLVVAIAACTLLGTLWAAREAVLGHYVMTLCLLSVAIRCAAAWMTASYALDDIRRHRARSP